MLEQIAKNYVIKLYGEFQPTDDKYYPIWGRRDFEKMCATYIKTADDIRLISLILIEISANYLQDMRTQSILRTIKNAGLCHVTLWRDTNTKSVVRESQKFKKEFGKPPTSDKLSHSLELTRTGLFPEMATEIQQKYNTRKDTYTESMNAFFARCDSFIQSAVVARNQINAEYKRARYLLKLSRKR